MHNTMTITYEAYGVKSTIILPDETPWPDVLSHIISLLNRYDSYRITSDKLREWAEDLED